MRRLSALLGFILLGCGATAVTAQHTVTVQGSVGSTTQWIDGSPLQTRILVGQDGETYVGVWISAPEQRVQVVERAPMAVSLVVDTSGSMAGDKIANARMAASSFLETLRDGDIVSIYAFHNGVTEIASPTVVSPMSRGGLMGRINMLQAMGGTNMWDGLQAGIARVREAPPSHPVRRVVLVGDGQANIGPSDPFSFGNLAAGSTEFGMQITSIGVGMDYDETTLGTVAVRSAGRFYHLAQPFQMAQILETELHLLSNTIATNAYIEVVPAAGVVILDGLTMGSIVEQGRLRVPLGSVYAGQEREVLFRARVDTAAPGARDLATARFVYERPGSSEQASYTAPLRYEVTRDQRAAQRSAAPRVSAMVANYEATRAQLDAAARLRQGDNTGAAVVLEQAQRRLEAAAAAAPAAPSSAGLRERAQSFDGQRRRAARATSPAEQRSIQLEANDAAMEAEAY
jgi:Ca-activated chloride channel family protein